MTTKRHYSLTKYLVALDRLSGQEVRLAELIIQDYNNPEIAYNGIMNF